jgi:hypothetical protein
MLHQDQDRNARRRNPTWWDDNRESGWERMKAAFRRDWEQTKADLSGGKKGQDLNQDASDTMRQATGKQHIPGDYQANPMDADDIEKRVKKAEKEMEKEAKRDTKEAERDTDRMRGNDRGRGWDRWNTWEEAEVPLMYGYGASSFYSNWDDESEQRMREEWNDLHPDTDWDDVRDTIRTGWDRTRPH